MNTGSHLGAAALALVLAAGSTVAWAQSEYRDERRQDNTHHTGAGATGKDAARAVTLNLVRASELMGKDIINANDDAIGSVENFIVERGSGQITHALVQTGDFLGLGGKIIALDYNRLGWDVGEEKFRLNMTQEQLERAAEFAPEDWADLRNDDWMDNIQSWWDGSDDDTDPYTDAIQDAEPKTVIGVVTDVNRFNTFEGQEYVAVDVRTDAGNNTTIVLGPSWYVMADAAAPMEGDRIRASAFTLPRDRDGRLVAASVNIENHTLNLRNDDHQPHWYADVDADVRTDDYDHRARLLRMNEIVGAPVVARDEEGGEIQDVIVERASGRVALFVVDPNENFLGIADTLRLVPWSVARVSADARVRIDADVDHLTRSVELPDDVSRLASLEALRPIYTAYDQELPEFRPMRAGDERAATDGRSGHDTSFRDTFHAGRDVTIEGKVTSVSKWDAGVNEHRQGEVQAIVVNTGRGESHTVFIAPEWYVDQQDLRIEKGDTVTIKGKAARYFNEDRVAAASIILNGKTYRLWQNGEPAWASATR